MTYPAVGSIVYLKNGDGFGHRVLEQIDSERLGPGVRVAPTAPKRWPGECVPGHYGFVRLDGLKAMPSC